MKNLIVLFLICSTSILAQTLEQKATLITNLINTRFSSSNLEKERDDKLAKINEIVKDEFETDAEFKKRKSESQSNATKIKSDYEFKINESKKTFNKHQIELKAELTFLLSQTIQNVESKFIVESYNAENNSFPVTLNISNQSTSVEVPREIARQFKTETNTLEAKGQKQLKENLEWDYFNWGVTLSTGQTFIFGEQRGVGAQVAQLQSTPPPSLTAKISFTEPSGNNALDANEKGKLTLTITNSGGGTALGFDTYISSENKTGLDFNPTLFVGEVPANSTRIAILEISASDQIKEGKSSFTFTFNEARGFPPDPIKITFDTRELLPPKFIIADVGVSEPSGNGKIENEEVVEITTRIQNIGRGVAKNVKISFDKGENIYWAEGSKLQLRIDELKAGSYFDAVVKFYANKKATDIPIYVSITEPSGKYDLNRIRLDQSKLALNVKVQQLQEVTIAGKERTSTNIEIAGGLSIDIEQNIPVTKQKNPNAVAVIIGIKEYANSDIPTVEYAKRDAIFMREYLIKVLGYDPKNILPQNPDELMTVGNMKSLIRQKVSSYLKPDGSSDIFVFYAGHGAPSTTSQQAFFVPYDCDPNFVSDDNAYKMQDFYNDISKLNARKKYVIIDACFSGQSGDGKAIVKNASPVLLKVDNSLFASKDAIVFQSSESNQVSNWYPEKKHGMFTYYFLKGLKGEADTNKDGSITVGELEGYINDENNNLPYVSRREFSRPQKAVVTGKLENIMLNLK